MTYYEKPDRNKIYRNTRARYPSWPARYALKFANDCLAYRLLFPNSTRPVAAVDDLPTGIGTGAMIAIEAPSNPWNPEWTSERLPGKWRCFQYPQEYGNGLRIVKRCARGYYADSFQDRTVCGIIVQLPSRYSGQATLLCGYVYEDEDDYIRLRTDDIEYAHCDDYENIPTGVGMDEAIRKADSYAEMAAEYDREEADKYEAERQIEEKKESICGLFKSRHDDGIEWAREQINELIGDIRSLIDEPWQVSY